MSEPRTVRRWGYSKDDKRIFELPIGEDLPEGYYDSPAKVPDEPEVDTEREDLLAEARSLGIDTRGRQSNETLRGKIAAAKAETAIEPSENASEGDAAPDLEPAGA